MSTSNAIPYGEAIIKGIWEYYGLTGYFKIRWASWRRGKTQYDNVKELWEDALNKSKNMEGQKKLSKRRIVKLVDFDFSEWFPWLPGMYWTPYGESLRHRGQQLRGEAPGRDIQKDKNLIHPHFETVTVLSGIGSLRVKPVEAKRDKPFKILGATTKTSNDKNRADISAGIPVVMSKNAYREIEDHISRRGVTKATVEGIYVDEIPNILEDISIDIPIRVPRFCIYVPSGRTISGIHDGDDTTAAGWSIFEDNKENYLMAFREFDVTPDEKGTDEAGYFLEKYIRRYEGKPLTDFDEYTKRLPARYSISHIKQGVIDKRKLQELHELKEKILSKYRPS
jgi:hypothetical protein